MTDRGCEVAAFYFPNWHVDPRNEAAHGNGWTEWELVKAARPRYPGHRQPIVPAWGYFDESQPQWMERQVDYAADHGVTAWLFDWYYYEDGPFLDRPLERGLFEARNQERIKFACMWANHDWIDIHPAKAGGKHPLLYPGRMGCAGFERMTDHVVRTYFPRKNHLTIDGCPFFSIYELGTFIEGLGGLSAAEEAVGAFREKVKRAGFPDLHLNAIIWGVKVLPTARGVVNREEVLRRLGINSATSYCWTHHFDFRSELPFPRAEYARALEVNKGVWEKMRTELPVVYWPNVSMGWDSSPRTVASDAYENRGYPFMRLLEGNTPAAFREALQAAKAFVMKQQTGPRMVTINAWNEWTEGSYLLPDTVEGDAYMEAVRMVFGGGGRSGGGEA